MSNLQVKNVPTDLSKRLRSYAAQRQRSIRDVVLEAVRRPDGAVSEASASEVGAHRRPFEVQFAPSVKPFAKSMSEAVAKTAGRSVFIALSTRKTRAPNGLAGRDDDHRLR